jgi:hypothetical protein
VFVVTTAVDNFNEILKTGTCSPDANDVWSCSLIPGAQSNSLVSCFDPAIETGLWSPAPGVGAPSTKITYQRTRSSANGTIALHASLLDFSSTVQITGWQSPCANGQNDWGQHDSMAVGPDGFHRVITDSTGGTCVRSNYTSSPLGISEVVFPIH